MISKYRKFFKKPRLEFYHSIVKKIGLLGTLPFYFGRANFSSIYLSHKPDSQLYFDRHNEYYDLFESFTKYNKLNNSGDSPRLWSFILNIKQILSEKIPGDFAELGVWRGNTASVLAHYADISNRKVYLFDTFEGFDSRDLRGVDKDKQMAFADTSLKMVMNVIGNSSRVCRFVKGYFPSTVTDEHNTNTYSIVSLDCDLYEPMKSGLDFFYPRMSKGGILFLHDYSSNFWNGAKKAVDEFCEKNEEYIVLIPDKSGSALVRKTR